MKIKILAFGIVREIFGKSFIELSVTGAPNIASLKSELEKSYPRLQQLASYLIAVNDEYAKDDQPIGDRDEIAIIPPVSGG